MIIPAIAGPMAPPIRFRRTVVPNDIPLRCRGVDSRTMLNPPTCINDNPVAIIACVPATNGDFNEERKDRRTLWR